MTDREQLRARILGFIADDSPRKADRDAILCEALRWQREHAAPYAKLCASHGTAEAPSHPREFPAIPTDIFRYAHVSSFDAAATTRVFRTSGTTNGARGEHSFCDLTLYDAAALRAAKYALFPDVKRMRVLCLTPAPSELRDSSLSYMLGLFVDTVGDVASRFFISNDRIDVDALKLSLARAMEENIPVALLGTSFAFVHADEALAYDRYALPEGSRIMQTGGFKGRSREFSPHEMRAMLSTRYGVPDALIVSEYGMTELSSQMYENTLRDALRHEPTRPRRLWVPPWVRVEIVHPETLAPVPHGEIGILRIDDMANLDSVCALQTADLAREDEYGVELLGRAPGAVPRGCSLAIDEILSQTKTR